MKLIILAIACAGYLQTYHSHCPDEVDNNDRSMLIVDGKFFDTYFTSECEARAKAIKAHRHLDAFCSKPQKGPQ